MFLPVITHRVKFCLINNVIINNCLMKKFLKICLYNQLQISNMNLPGDERDIIIYSISPGAKNRSINTYTVGVIREVFFWKQWEMKRRWIVCVQSLLISVRRLFVVPLPGIVFYCKFITVNAISLFVLLTWIKPETFL